MGLTLAMTLIFEFSRSYVILTIWWPRSGVRIYQIVTGVTSVVGVPSTHLVIDTMIQVIMCKPVCICNVTSSPISLGSPDSVYIILIFIWRLAQELCLYDQWAATLIPMYQVGENIFVRIPYSVKVVSQYLLGFCGPYRKVLSDQWKYIEILIHQT